MSKKNNFTSKHVWLLCAILLISCLYFWSVQILITLRQTDNLLIVSIIASTVSSWGAWYSFLKKWRLLCLWGGLMCLFSVWLVAMAIVDVVNPQLL